MATTAVAPRGSRWQFSQQHPIWAMVARRVALGIVTLLFLSMIVFAATEVLPGNAATAILGQQQTPERVAAIEERLHLNDPIPEQYLRWIGSFVQGDAGTSFSSEQPVWSVVGPRLANSAFLVVAATLIGTFLGVWLGVLAASRRDSKLDHGLSLVALTVTALPEFLVALALVMVFATLVWQVLPAVSAFPPEDSPWSHLKELVLPVATLVIVIVPYLFRMTRAAVIDALESDYVEMARLKGVRPKRILYVHALLAAVPTIIQVVGLQILYLAGGIVIVEFLFNYQGVGQQLVTAVSDRDVPVIQCTVLVLAALYVFVNIVTDVLALIATPRRRLPRVGR